METRAHECVWRGAREISVLQDLPSAPFCCRHQGVKAGSPECAGAVTVKKRKEITFCSESIESDKGISFSVSDPVSVLDHAAFSTVSEIGLPAPFIVRVYCAQ